MPEFCRVLLAMAFAIVAASHGVFAFDLDRVLTKGTKVVSVEGALAHFGSRLNNGLGYVQAWNLGARIFPCSHSASRAPSSSAVWPMERSRSASSRPSSASTRCIRTSLALDWTSDTTSCTSVVGDSCPG